MVGGSSGGQEQVTAAAPNHEFEQVGDKMSCAPTDPCVPSEHLLVFKTDEFG